MADTIARGLAQKNALKEMFPTSIYIKLEGLTIGNFILTPTKVALGTVTLA